MQIHRGVALTIELLPGRMISFSSRPISPHWKLKREHTRSENVHRRDKCQGQTRQPKFRHFTVRYVFRYSLAATMAASTFLPMLFRAKL